MTTDPPTLGLPAPPANSRAATTVVPGDQTADARALFADITKMTPRDEAAESAFLASKMHMVRTHPALDLTARATAVADLAGTLPQAITPTPTGPVPGGVGYEMFYNNSFKSNWSTVSGTDHWYNQVWLSNHAVNRWDLIYQFDYQATLAEQQGVWAGSWGPIVETFQNPYQGTNPMGALNTQMLARAGNNQWGAWRLLGSSDSDVRTDNTGFHLLFLDPNYSWAVDS